MATCVCGSYQCQAFNMKPFLTKALDAVTFGQLRRRGTISSFPDNATDGSINASSSSPPRYREHPERDWSVYCKSTSLDEVQTNEDDVVFCKNNVYLKYPNRKGRHQNGESFSDGSSTTSNSGSMTESMTSHSIPLKTLPSAAHSQTVDQDSNILIPGYFHISTRGSDFGQTLIMNWSPNSLMSQSDNPPLTSSPAEATATATMATAGSNGNKYQYDKPSVSSLSIDLSQMESIRVFYQSDPFDPIGGGEIVICTRERRFKIFLFKHGGLNDLIKKFCSWKYFNHQHQAHAHQYLFTVFRPRLSLAELHPEEGLINGLLTEDLLSQLKDTTGRILDKKQVLQVY